LDWLGEDLVRTALLTGLVAALVVMVVQGRVPDEERRLAVWRAVVAAGWFAVVLGQAWRRASTRICACVRRPPLRGMQRRLVRLLVTRRGLSPVR
jgi:hypothetical protein